MNNSLNEYLRFNFELNIELNNFLARFNIKMNNQNVSATPRVGGYFLYNDDDAGPGVTMSALRARPCVYFGASKKSSPKSHKR